MEQSIHYKTKILEEIFTTEDGREYSSTAIIEKYKGQSKLTTIKYGVVNHEELYQSIHKGDSINISNCYLKDFSLKQYRKQLKLNDAEPVQLQSFKADNTFFESEFGTDFSYAIFEGQSSSFAYAIFNLGTVKFSYSKCATNLNFNHAEFNLEELNFKFSEFEEGDIRFSAAVFNCTSVNFINTNFGKGNVNFRNANFSSSNVSFQYARFDNGDLTFDKSIFNGRTIDFRKVEFGRGKRDFKRVYFGDGNISFTESEFKEGRINFRSAIFGKGEKKFDSVDFGNNEVYFDGSTFDNGLLSFNNSNFNILSLTDCNLGGHCDFRIKKGILIDLSFSICKYILDFQSSTVKVDLETLKIEGIKNMGKIFISWQKNNAYKLITSQTKSSFESKASQFHLLKESFHENGKFNSEDSAYVAFKRFEMLAELEAGKEQNSFKSIYSSAIYLVKKLIFDKAGLFATSPTRVLLSMLIVLCAFSISYIILPHFTHAEIVSSIGAPDHLNIVERSFYHSAITFFTIGYGDFYPSGHIRWLSAVEGWAGVFLMSYFTVAFVRKILR